jgi:hypothetical protein
MNFVIHQLTINCKKERDILPFVQFNYFYGPMGSGKSTIARLIDFCLGGKLDSTPALQQEFISATLEVHIGGKPLLLTRRVDEDKIHAQWTEAEQPYDLLLPARKAAGEVLPGTGVEVLSDLLFRLADITPPRVRKGKIKEDSELVRLSFRDLLWYCYLDQDSMDSSFFNLDEDSNFAVRLKSRDVLRFIIGFHQENVSELEAELEQVRTDRIRCEGAAQAIKEALEAEQLATPAEIEAQREKIKKDVDGLALQIDSIRADMGKTRTHETELLQARGRKLSLHIAQIDDALSEVEQNISKDKGHRNTLLSLTIRQKRAQSARTVLTGVDFTECPQCYQTLQSREADKCPVCGQSHVKMLQSPIDEDSIEADTKARADELNQRITLQMEELGRLKRQRQQLAAEKAVVDQDLSQASREYDSAYLASALAMEKERARLLQRAEDLKQVEALTKKVEWLQNESIRLAGRETEIRGELKIARAEAEKDTSNLELLQSLFLDCLLRSRLAGFLRDDFVEINSPWFLPRVYGRNSGDIVQTSFANLSSGGKKTFFKCCFAVAVHRLAARTGAFLPKILIIDSPMKNVSERTNAEQFAGFHEMLHELIETELKDTQFIIIDKEIFRPKAGMALEFRERHMKPDDAENPPLIRNYRGK